MSDETDPRSQNRAQPGEERIRRWRTIWGLDPETGARLPVGEEGPEQA